MRHPVTIQDVILECVAVLTRLKNKSKLDQLSYLGRRAGFHGRHFRCCVENCGGYTLCAAHFPPPTLPPVLTGHASSLLPY